MRPGDRRDIRPESSGPAALAAASTPLRAVPDLQRAGRIRRQSPRFAETVFPDLGIVFDLRGFKMRRDDRLGLSPK